MQQSLNKEVNFLGEPMRIWEIPLSFVAISLILVIGSMLAIVAIVVCTILWIIFPAFRRKLDDTAVDIFD